VRGWVSADIGIDDVPPAPSGEVDLVGWLQPTESNQSGQSGSQSEEDAEPDHGDRVIRHLRVADLVQLLDGQDLYGAYVVAREALPADAAAGVDAATLDQLPPASRFTGLRNILYAIEWWVFAAFAVFLWWRYVRDATAEPPLGEPADEGDPEGAVPSKP
jgi:surfeit locus 1 family protein